jgi:hypothetical protein
MEEQGGVVALEGAEADWSRAQVRFPEGILELSRKMFQPASEFSRIILGAHNYFRAIETSYGSAKKRVLALLEQAEMMIGVRATPGVGPEDARWYSLLAVASSLDGLIFDGSNMLDDAGRVVLGADGDSEV